MYSSEDRSLRVCKLFFEATWKFEQRDGDFPKEMFAEMCEATLGSLKIIKGPKDVFESWEERTRNGFEKSYWEQWKVPPDLGLFPFFAFSLEAITRELSVIIDKDEIQPKLSRDLEMIEKIINFVEGIEKFKVLKESFSKFRMEKVIIKVSNDIKTKEIDLSALPIKRIKLSVDLKLISV